MGYGVNSIRNENDLISILDNYRQILEEDGFSSITNKISELLQASLKAQNLADDSLRKASATYHLDQAVQCLNTADLPVDARIARYVFYTIIRRELVNTFEVSGFIIQQDLQVDYSQDFKTQAAAYETLASLPSSEYRFMRNSLRSALYCYLQSNQGEESQDSRRIRSFLEALETPVKLKGAISYFLIFLENNGISFSITHPRFIEALTDICNSVNESTSDEAFDRAKEKWIELLR